MLTKRSGSSGGIQARAPTAGRPRKALHHARKPLAPRRGLGVPALFALVGVDLLFQIRRGSSVSIEAGLGDRGFPDHAGSEVAPSIVDRHAGRQLGTVPWLRQGWRQLRSDVTRGGVGGLPSTLSRVAGLILRFPAHRRWLRTIQGPTTRSIVEAYPRIIYRPSATYLYSGTTWSQRLLMLEAHYAFLNRTFSAASFSRLIAPGGVQLWTLAKSDHCFAITLEGPCRITKHREGELNLTFLMDGVPLYRLAFSLAPTCIFRPGGTTETSSGQLLIYVGQVQGSPHRFQEIRAATTICQDSAPRDLLINALFGIADAWNIAWIGGVSSARHLTTDASRPDRLFPQYDDWWKALEAERSPEGHYLINLSERDSRPNRRAVSRTRNKKRFKRALRISIAQSILEL